MYTRMSCQPQSTHTHTHTYTHRYTHTYVHTTPLEWAVMTALHASPSPQLRVAGALTLNPTTRSLLSPLGRVLRESRKLPHKVLSPSYNRAVKTGTRAVIYITIPDLSQTYLYPNLWYHCIT